MPFTFSAENVVVGLHMIQYLRNEEREICDILSQNKSMNPLTNEQERQFAAAILCPGCAQELTPGNPKTHHHCHPTDVVVIVTKLF